jgi:integrase
VLTLLRMRAMLRLTWDRIDLEDKTAWIRRRRQKQCKTFQFPLSVDVIELLRRLRELNPKGDHVFQWEGKPIDDCNTRAFQEAVKRADVAPLRWHDLRHTGASWAAQSG